MKTLLGRVNQLKMVKRTANGIYLSPEGSPDITILLPNNQTPEDISEGDFIEVFVYKDSEDRPIATTAKPKLTFGKVARCKVKDVTDIGAFLDWGLAKDLFLPFKEQIIPVKKDQEILVALYIDKSERLCATTHIYHYLEADAPYKKGDSVHGTIYEILNAFGTFVAVDDKYLALIPHNEMNQLFEIGQPIDAKVKEVREDGKLTLTLTENVPLQMGIDAEIILERLEAAGGFLPFHDKTSKEIILREFKMSKNAFKRALGRLLKAGAITFVEGGIKKK